MPKKGRKEERDREASEAEIASESDDGGSSDGGDDAVDGAVSHALDALVGLESDDLESAMQEMRSACALSGVHIWACFASVCGCAKR